MENIEQVVKGYELPIDSKVSLRMPLKSEVLALGNEFGRLVLYARTPVRFEYEEARSFHVTPVGNAFLTQVTLRFIGFTSLRNSSFFVFEEVPEP